MSVTTYPQGGDGRSLHALFPARAQSIAFTVTSARNSADFAEGVKVVDLYATQDVFVKFGTSSVTAATTDVFVKASTITRYATHANLRLAAIRSTADGTLFITELE